MSEETKNDETPEEEVAPAEATPAEAAEESPADAAASAEAAAEEEAPVKEEAPAEDAAEEVVEAAAEEVAEEAAAEEEAPAEEAKAEEEAPAEEEAKAEEEAPAAEETPAKEEDAPAEDAPADAASAEDTPAETDDGKFDKLKKAEEILRSNAPPSARGEDLENAFEKVVHINRCAKVVKGGRRFSFSALVVSGDREGKVGFGFGKAQEVAECIKKASEASKRTMVSVNITDNTIPHRVIGEHGGGRVLLRPASPGTGLIAGGGVRAVVEAAGIKDVLAKSLGSNNQANVVKATLNALEQLRSKEEIYSIRGKRAPEKKAL